MARERCSGACRGSTRPGSWITTKDGHSNKIQQQPRSAKTRSLPRPEGTARFHPRSHARRVLYTREMPGGGARWKSHTHPNRALTNVPQISTRSVSIAKPSCVTLAKRACRYRDDDVKLRPCPSMSPVPTSVEAAMPDLSHSCRSGADAASIILALRVGRDGHDFEVSFRRLASVRATSSPRAR
jgi:hypothetical protein